MSDPLVPGYRIEQKLGSGATGDVYRAVSSADGRVVAVKILHADGVGLDEARRRFEREARALTTLRHPNVIDVIEFGQSPEGLYMVMELLEGRTLGTLLEADGPPRPAAALAMADQILAGLAFAHAHGVLHRDLKPDNVFVVDGAGPAKVKLLDFGLAKLDRGVWGEASMTALGSMMGTPGYMPPEQAMGARADARSDVYAAGVLLFELLTGHWPFYADDVPQLIRAHALDPVPSLGDIRADLCVQPALEAVIRTALAKRPDERWDDAAAMRAALRNVPQPAAWIA